MACSVEPEPLPWLSLYPVLSVSGDLAQPDQCDVQIPMLVDSPFDFRLAALAPDIGQSSDEESHTNGRIVTRRAVIMSDIFFQFLRVLELLHQ